MTDVVTPGAAPAPVATPAANVPADNAPATPAEPTNPNPTEKSKEAESAQRYAIMRERQAREQAERRVAELEAKSKEKAPEFTDENDPDGLNQMEYLAAKKAEELFDKRLKELGLDSKVEEIRMARAQDEFFEHVKSASSEFGHLQLDVSKEAVKSALERFETKGITARELVILANAEKFASSAAPKMQAPGEGSKTPPPDAKPTTNQEVYDGIFKRFGLAG